MADGLGTAIAGFFGAMPNTSYSQNVGLVVLTGMMSRYVVSCGAVFFIIAGLIPKFGAIISAMPNAVLGGAAIIMFGMIVSAGLNLLSEVKMNRCNMVIVALSLGIGLGLAAAPKAIGIFPAELKIPLVSGLFTSALVATVLNIILPEED